MQGEVELKVKLRLEELNKSVADASKTVQGLDQVKATVRVDLERGRIQRQLSELNGQLNKLDAQVVTPEVELQKQRIEPELEAIKAELLSLDRLSVNPVVEFRKNNIKADISAINSQLAALNSEVASPQVQIRKDKLQADLANARSELLSLNKLAINPTIELRKEKLKADLAKVQAQLDSVGASVQVAVELEKNDVITAIATLKSQLKEIDKIDTRINIDTSSVVKANTLIDNLVAGIGQGIGQTIFTQIQQQAFAAAAAIPRVTLEFEKLQTALKTALTGLSTSSEEAFNFIQDFAASTPFQVQELTDSYIKLQNRGIKPTAELLTSLGDITSGQGKGLNQIVEAVLAASQGQNERLIDFGIRATAIGDKTNISFRNFNKTVERTPEAITAAFIELGKLEGVAGGMTAQSKTLGGALSNLEDATARTSVAFGEQLTPALSKIIKGFTEAVANSDTFAREIGKNTAAAISLVTDNADKLATGITAIAAAYGTYTLAVTLNTKAVGINQVVNKALLLDIKTGIGLFAAKTLAKLKATAAATALSLANGTLLLSLKGTAIGLKAVAVSATFAAGVLAALALGAVVAGNALKDLAIGQNAVDNLDEYNKQANATIGSNLAIARSLINVTAEIERNGKATDEQKAKAKAGIAIAQAAIAATQSQIDALKALEVNDQTRANRDQAIRERENTIEFFKRVIAGAEAATGVVKKATDSLKELEKQFTKASLDLQLNEIKASRELLKVRIANSENAFEAEKKFKEDSLKLSLKTAEAEERQANIEFNKLVAKQKELSDLKAKLSRADKPNEGPGSENFTPQQEQELEKLILDVPKKRNELEKAVSKTIQQRFALIEEERQKQLQAIQEVAARAKAASDSKIAGIELEIAKQGQINALADANRAVSQQQQAVAKATTELIVQGFDQQLQSLERAGSLSKELNQIRSRDEKDIQADRAKADQIQQQLNSGAITNAQQRRDAEAQISALRQGDGEIQKALQNELARLGFSANTTEKDFLLTKQKIENQLAETKKNALLTEQKIQKDNLELDLQRNKLARDQAQIQAQINLLRAQAETKDAEVAIALEQNPATKAIKESVLAIRKDQESLAKDAIANQIEINKAQAKGDEISKELLKKTQEKVRSELEFSDATRKNTQLIDQGRLAQNEKNKAIKEGTKEQADQNELIREANELTLKGIFDAAKARDDARKAQRGVFETEGTTDPAQAVRKAIELQQELGKLNNNNPFGGSGFNFGSLTGQNDRDLRDKLEKQLGLSKGSSTLAGGFKQIGTPSIRGGLGQAQLQSPSSLSLGVPNTTNNNNQSQITNNNEITINNSDDQFGDITRTLIALNRV